MKGTCWDSRIFLNYSYAVGAYTAFTDIVLALVPITSFWNLQMRRSTKISVSIMMGLTLFSAVCTAAKTAYLKLLDDHTDPREFHWPILGTITTIYLMY